MKIYKCGDEIITMNSLCHKSPSVCLPVRLLFKSTNTRFRQLSLFVRVKYIVLYGFKQ